MTHYYSYAEMAKEMATELGMPISEWKRLNPKDTVSLEVGPRTTPRVPSYSDLAKRGARKERMPISEWKRLNPRQPREDAEVVEAVTE